MTEQNAVVLNKAPSKAERRAARKAEREQTDSTQVDATQAVVVTDTATGNRIEAELERQETAAILADSGASRQSAGEQSPTNDHSAGETPPPDTSHETFPLPAILIPLCGESIEKTMLMALAAMSDANSQEGTGLVQLGLSMYQYKARRTALAKAAQSDKASALKSLGDANWSSAKAWVMNQLLSADNVYDVSEQQVNYAYRVARHMERCEHPEYFVGIGAGSITKTVLPAFDRIYAEQSLPVWIMSPVSRTFEPVTIDRVGEFCELARNMTAKQFAENVRLEDIAPEVKVDATGIPENNPPKTRDNNRSVNVVLNSASKTQKLFTQLVNDAKQNVSIRDVNTDKLIAFIRTILPAGWQLVETPSTPATNVPETPANVAVDTTKTA